MLKLPQLPQGLKKNRREIVALRGVNYSDMLQDGDLRECLNLSARRYPYLTTREGRTALPGYSGITAMTAWEKLVTVSGTSLLYDGEAVGTVTEGKKQFAVVNTKMVIWPDKVYLDLNDLTLHPLGAEVSGTGAEFTTDTMTIDWEGVDLTEHFKPGDAVTISGCTANTANNIDLVIRDLTATTLKVQSDGFAEAEETGTITITRSVPDMDFICESNNRLWGCSSEKQTLYASASGEPTNFNVFQGLSTDSYALAVGSEGNFTGCCKLGSSVLFWKESKLHKILGTYPAEYGLYDYDIEGLQAGCHKSLQVINETLFYQGPHGIYAYSGGTPTQISANFGAREFAGGVGGSDGERYFLSLREGEARHLYVYEPRYGLWLREDDTGCVDFARIGKALYFLSEDGHVYQTQTTAGQAGMPWEAQFTPFYETIEGRKRFSRMMLRLELPEGSRLQPSVRYDGGPWEGLKALAGSKYDAVSLRIPIRRCDKFELKLSGTGPCAVLSVLREFSVGSDR